MGYDQTVDERIEESKVMCNIHGELSSENLDITTRGKLVCVHCSLNNEMDVRNERDIDPSIRVEF